VAANLAMCALGTDTSGSVRNPALTTISQGWCDSGFGQPRRYFSPDIHARPSRPLCRTVQDVAFVLESLAGYDPKDAATAATTGPRVPYRRFANEKSLAGKRLGVLRD